MFISECRVRNLAVFLTLFIEYLLDPVGIPDICSGVSVEIVDDGIIDQWRL